MSEWFKTAGSIAMSVEVFEGVVRPWSFAEMYQQMLEDQEHERVHGPQLRPTRREYDEVMEPVRRREAKVRSLRWNVPNLRRLSADAFVRAG